MRGMAQRMSDSRDLTVGWGFRALQVFLPAMVRSAAGFTPFGALVVTEETIDARCVHPGMDHMLRAVSAQAAAPLKCEFRAFPSQCLPAGTTAFQILFFIACAYVRLLGCAQAPSLHHISLRRTADDTRIEPLW